MTELEWERCAGPQKMLAYLRTISKLTVRKGCLFTAACCRRLWPHLSREAHRVVEAAERYADRMDDEDELVKAVKVFTGWQGKLTLETWLRARRLFHSRLPDLDTSTT